MKFVTATLLLLIFITQIAIVAQLRYQNQLMSGDTPQQNQFMQVVNYIKGEIK